MSTAIQIESVPLLALASDEHHDEHAEGGDGDNDRHDVHSDNDRHDVHSDNVVDTAVEPKLTRWALASLLMQHASSTLINGVYYFAAFLFLIEIYRDTLVPSSLVGFFTTACGLILSSYIGGIVDRAPRLKFVQYAIAVQKTLQAGNYALFLLLFGPLRDVASAAFHGRAEPAQVLATWCILLITIACSSALGLANTGITIAVERDWVTTIAAGHTGTLTRLNTYMRRIDLLSKLCAPIFVSFLTTMWGYSTTTLILLILSVVTAFTEVGWIAVVYARLPSLARSLRASHTDGDARSVGQTWVEWARGEWDDWADFIRLPVFGTSIAIATVYLTTLNYDGTFIAYVKVARGWDDEFIALMRGLCLLTGLLGTAIMPALERAIGLERAGAWSIWFEVACLSPVACSFFYGTGSYGEHGPPWNSAVLFGGIALSRIGLWSFDLCQLKVLQLALEEHPRRNRIFALQIALQNLFDLTKYAVTLAAASPARFKWTALVSWVAVLAGAIAYAVYLKTVRGHLIHLDWLKTRSC